MQPPLSDKSATMQSDRIQNSAVRAVAATLLGRIWPDILFGLLVILNVVRTLRHAMWRDEFQAFQIATHTANFSELFHSFRSEGHPGLWYALLWGLSRISTDPILMQLLHIGIAVGVWLLVFRCSPFTTIEKFLLILSYFLFWEYFVISRNYALVALLGFGFIALRGSRSSFEFVPWILLGLLANSFVYGTIWSMALAAVFVVEQKNRLTARFIGGMCVYLVCFAIAVATMMLPSFSQQFHQISIPTSATRIHELLTIPIGALFPIRPDWLFDSVAFVVNAGYGQPPEFWNPNPISQLDQFLDWFLGNNAELPLMLSAMLAFPVAICWLLVRPTPVAGGDRRRIKDKLLRRQWSQSRHALIGFMIVYVGILLFAVLFKFIGSARHHGILFLALVGYVWGSRTSASLFARQHTLWYAILILSAISGIATLSSELRPFSNGRNVATWLKSNNLTEQFIVGISVGMAIPGYLKRPIYVLECEDEAMFWDRSKRCTGIRSINDLIDRINRAIAKSAGREVILILTEEDDASREFINTAPDTTSSRDLTLIQIFGGSVSEENYHVFRLTTDRIVLNTAAQIQVVEATYGLNCKDYKVTPPNQNTVASGNVTAAVKLACEKRSRECKFDIDISKLGDPANACGKDFSVGWRCGNDEEIHEARVAAPADDKSILLSCP